MRGLHLFYSTCLEAQNLLDNADQELKRELLIPGVGIFVRWSLAPGESIISPDEEIPFKLSKYITVYCELHAIQDYLVRLPREQRGEK